MNVTLLVVGKDPKAGPVALEAARSVFPGPAVRIVESMEAALRSLPAVGTELLVLTNPDPAEALQAVEAVDGYCLPRWAVVVLGTSDRPDEIVVPPEDWNPRAVACALRSAATQFAVRRENVRARGDLKTISRRLTHDLRAQVGGILTTAEALSEAMADRPNASELKPIIDATEETVKLIDRISFVVGASADPKAKEPFDMGLACWAATQRLEMQTRKKHAIVVQSKSCPEVEGVLSWLEVVWWNLLSNALQHGAKESLIEFGWCRDGNEFRFWIQDDGNGVPDEKRPLLFYPFHLLHKPNAPNGLGLPIVRRLVELQGGRCGYQRVENKSRFFFTLPTG